MICRACHFKFHLVSGEVTHFEQDVVQVGKPGSTSKATIELRRYHLRVMRPSQTLPELFEFDRSPEASILRCVKGDRVLLIFSGEAEQLLQLHNLSTSLNLKIKAPQSDALMAAQILAFALGALCTGYLSINKITSFQVALVGSSVLSVGFGYGVYRRLQPKEKDLDVRQRLSAVQEHLQIQSRVEQGLANVRKTQEADQIVIDKLYSLKGCMACDPALYNERLRACDQSLSIMAQKSALLEEQASGFMKVLNMLKVEVLTSQVADQLPDAIGDDILELMAQLEAITEKVDALALQISSAQALQFEPNKQGAY